jgi:hypothetical protein
VLASSAVTETLNRIGEYNKLASACLSDLPDSPTRTGLMDSPIPGDAATARSHAQVPIPSTEVFRIRQQHVPRP